MNDLISATHCMQPLSTLASHDIPADSLCADVAEESQADTVLKFRLARDRAQSHLLVTTRRQDLLMSLQQAIKGRASQPEQVDSLASDDVLEQLSDELQNASQKSMYSMRDLSGAVDQVMDTIDSDMSVFGTDESHRDFFDRLAETMKDLDENWLSNYEDALAKYIEFFSEFNKIMADLQKSIEASSDGQKVTITFTGILNRLVALRAKYRGEGEGLASFPTREEAQKFIDDLGLGGMQIVQRSDGSYEVMIDLGPITDMINTMPIQGMLPDGGYKSVVTWDMARYNAWLSGKDSQTEQLQHVSKVLGEKYSRNLQLLDTLIKVLSSSIDSMGEADRTFINNF